jgi:putative FmdB family regulatory protein
MPLYEYECEADGSRFEVIQKFSDPPVEVCPKCGGPVRKLLSSPAIQFKGTGWYITDYAKKSSTDAGRTDGGKTDGGKTDSGKDTKSSSSSSDSSAAKPAAASSTTSSSGSGSEK